MEPLVRDYSQMEIENGYRNANLCDGAKDKGTTKVQFWEQAKPINVHLHCSDGVLIDAQPFKSESNVVRTRFKHNFGNKEVENDSKTLEMVKVFCEGRAKILDIDYDRVIEDYYPLVKLAQNKLNEFNSIFLHDYRSHATQLITAAFELEIISLIHLMIEQVVNLFTKMTEDEVYNFFFVNLKEFLEDIFKVMEEDLLCCQEFFCTNIIDSYNIASKGELDLRDIYLDSDLLKQKFHSLENYEQQRQWLTAHFLLRRPVLAENYREYLEESAAADAEEEYYKMTHISQMEIGISDRNANMCDGATDKGKTKISRKERYMLQYEFNEQGARYRVVKVSLHCSDGVRIDGEPFKRESRVLRQSYMCDFCKTVESNSKTLEMVKVFCEGRGKILDDDDYDNAAHKLNEFNSKFLQDYRSYAIQLLIAAFQLEIISLIHLMMEEAVNLFTKMTEDEVYNFFVNLKEFCRDKFEGMKLDLWNRHEFFSTNIIDSYNIASKGVLDVRANNYWDSDLLKQKFHSLETYKQRRQWVTAHFLFRRPRFSNYFR